MLTIGSTVWLFDENRRVYPVADLKIGRSPIYREHWRPCKIIGETKQSWIIDWYDRKLPKRDTAKQFGRYGGYRSWAITAEEVDEDCWATSNRHRVRDMINFCSTEQLRSIATILGYKEAPTHATN